MARQLPPIHVHRAVPAEAPDRAINRKGVRRYPQRAAGLGESARHRSQPKRKLMPANALKLAASPTNVLSGRLPHLWASEHHHAKLHGLNNSFGPRIDFEFFKNRANVKLHCMKGNPKLASDFFVGEAIGQRC